MTNAIYADTAYWQFVRLALPFAQLPEGILQFADAGFRRNDGKKLNRRIGNAA